MIHKTASNLVKATKVPRSSKSRVSTQEKRARRYRSVQNRDFRDRIGRVFSQRMYLDNQEDFPADKLVTIFANAPVVLAKKEVVYAYKKIFREEDDAVEDQKICELIPAVPSVEKELDVDCPVCFDRMSGKEALDRSSTCKNFIHQDCFKRWIKIQRTCCYCRTEWCSLKGAEAVAGSSSNCGGVAAARTATPAAAAMTRDGRYTVYVNFGAQQYLSKSNDGSTYYYRRVWRNRYRNR